MDNAALISHVHANTPHVAVIDNRGLPVRHVAYWRRDDNGGIPEPRTTAWQHDAVGRLIVQRDPRFLAETSRPNLTTVFSLAEAALLTDSVDAGWRLVLSGADAGVQESWDGRGSHWLHDYDSQRRLVAIHEHPANAPLSTIERLTYADNAVEFAERNQCGQLIRHDDTAGTLHLQECNLRGELLVQTRQFLTALQSPDWPLLPIERNHRVEQQEGFVTRRRYSTCGEMLAQADAGGHRQTWRFDRNGQLQSVALQISESTVRHVVLRGLQYNAQGQIELQSNGNGTTTVCQFDPANGRLNRLLTHQTDVRRLQDLSYRYDAGGNILNVQDHTQPVHFFANQRVEACHCYCYDSLSQLISATGREAMGQSIRPDLPELMPDPADSSRLLNYTEHYDYDSGGNLTLLRHESGHPGQSYRRTFEVAQDSNRAVAQDEVRPADFLRDFDHNGNLQTLSPHGQGMLWTARNHLQKITLVSRGGREDDAQTFCYDHQGLRVRKQQRTLASGTLHVREVRYLPGLEIRTLDNAEHLQVITLEAGGVQIRCLHWITAPPEGVRQDAMRYGLKDHLGSSTLELDAQAEVITHEGYYPYGGTAWWAARNEVQARCKTIRYSGKERENSGLYDYGLRNYAPWLCRWISPDPAGDMDGLNLYRMVKNNPLRNVDVLGQMAEEISLPPDMEFEGMTDEHRRKLLGLLEAKRTLQNAINNVRAPSLGGPVRWMQRYFSEHTETKLTSLGLGLGAWAGGLIGGILNETAEPDGGSAGGGAAADSAGTVIGGIIGGLTGKFAARLLLRIYGSTLVGRLDEDIESYMASIRPNNELSVINASEAPPRVPEMEVNRNGAMMESPEACPQNVQDARTAGVTMNAPSEATNSPLVSNILGRHTVIDLRGIPDRMEPENESGEQAGFQHRFRSWFDRTSVVS